MRKKMYADFYEPFFLVNRIFFLIFALSNLIMYSYD